MTTININGWEDVKKNKDSWENLIKAKQGTMSGEELNKLLKEQSQRAKSVFDYKQAVKSKIQELRE